MEGSLHWIHVASTSLYTLLVCHKRRGTVAMDDIGVIATMSGVAIHDGWKPYRSTTSSTPYATRTTSESSPASSSTSTRTGPTR